jgi:hypothetical protein
LQLFEHNGFWQDFSVPENRVFQQNRPVAAIHEMHKIPDTLNIALVILDGKIDLIVLWVGYRTD